LDDFDSFGLDERSVLDVEPESLVDDEVSDFDDDSPDFDEDSPDLDSPDDALEREERESVA
jgi:hypothetical protein